MNDSRGFEAKPLSPNDQGSTENEPFVQPERFPVTDEIMIKAREFIY